MSGPRLVYPSPMLTPRRSRRLLPGLLASVLLLLIGCPTGDGPSGDDDDATGPGLDDPGCTLVVTNGLSEAITSFNTADNATQFDAVDLIDSPLASGDSRNLEIIPQGHHLVARDGSGAWYEVGWVLCVWDETLMIDVEQEDLRVPGLKVENGTSEDIVTLTLSPVGTLDWSENLLAGDPIPQFSNRVFPLAEGRWYALARNSQGLGYLANFELLAAPPQVELGISRMLTVPGEPCGWTIVNQHIEELVRVTFTEQFTGAFLATGLPEGEMLPNGDSVDGVLAPGTWDLDVRFMDGGQAVDSGFVCTDGETYVFEAAP